MPQHLPLSQNPQTILRAAAYLLKHGDQSQKLLIDHLFNFLCTAIKEKRIKPEQLALHNKLEEHSFFAILLQHASKFKSIQTFLTIHSEPFSSWEWAIQRPYPAHLLFQQYKAHDLNKHWWIIKKINDLDATTHWNAKDKDGNSAFLLLCQNLSLLIVPPFLALINDGFKKIDFTVHHKDNNFTPLTWILIHATSSHSSQRAAQLALDQLLEKQTSLFYQLDLSVKLKNRRSLLTHIQLANKDYLFALLQAQIDAAIQKLHKDEEISHALQNVRYIINNTTLTAPQKKQIDHFFKVVENHQKTTALKKEKEKIDMLFKSLLTPRIIRRNEGNVPPPQRINHLCNTQDTDHSSAFFKVKP